MIKVWEERAARCLFIISYVYPAREDLIRAYAIPAGSILLLLQARRNWRREIPEKIENQGNPRERTFVTDKRCRCRPLQIPVKILIFRR